MQKRGRMQCVRRCAQLRNGIALDVQITQSGEQQQRMPRHTSQPIAGQIERVQFARLGGKHTVVELFESQSGVADAKLLQLFELCECAHFQTGELVVAEVEPKDAAEFDDAGRAGQIVVRKVERFDLVERIVAVVCFEFDAVCSNNS